MGGEHEMGPGPPGPREGAGGLGCSTPASLLSPLPGPWRGCPRSRVCALRMRRRPGPHPAWQGATPGLRRPRTGEWRRKPASFVYELGENTRRSPNVPHKLTVVKVKQIKRGGSYY